MLQVPKRDSPYARDLTPRQLRYQQRQQLSRDDRTLAEVVQSAVRESDVIRAVKCRQDIRAELRDLADADHAEESDARLLDEAKATIDEQSDLIAALTLRAEEAEKTLEESKVTPLAQFMARRAETNQHRGAVS